MIIPRQWFAPFHTQVTLLDPKVQQNVGIALAKYRMPSKDIKVPIFPPYHTYYYIITSTHYGATIIYYIH